MKLKIRSLILMVGVIAGCSPFRAFYNPSGPFFEGWSNVLAVGQKTPSLQAPDIAPAPAQVTISWNAVKYYGAMISSYNVYRATATGHEDFTRPLATGISPAALTYTDTTVVSGNTYYYEIAPVINGKVMSLPAAADIEISVVIPPANMALIHPWIANREACDLMGRVVDRANHYRCLYHGPGNVAGYLDMQTPLFVDSYGEGCNYTHGTACAGADCIGNVGAPSNAVGADGSVYYDRNAATCYAKVNGAWIAANDADSSTLQLMTSNAPGLPPLVHINQSQSWRACQSVSVAGFAQPKRLLTHREQLTASAWSPSFSDAQIANLEDGRNLPSSGACNTNNGSGLVFSVAAIPSDLNTLPGQGTCSSDEDVCESIYSVRIGSSATSNCVSRFGIQDMVGNVWSWSSDQLSSCSSATHTCQGQASGLDPNNRDWNGFNFDGKIGPGGAFSGGGTFASKSLGYFNYGAPFGSFQVVLGLPMVSSAPSSWDSLVIGTNAGQFNPMLFHGNYFWLYTDNANGSPARGAFAGGDWENGAAAGRFSLVVAGAPEEASKYIGFRCALE